MLPVYQDSTFLGHVDKVFNIRWGSKAVHLPAMPGAFHPADLEAVSFDLDQCAIEFAPNFIDEMENPQEELWKRYRVPPTAKRDHNGIADMWRFSWQFVKVRNAAEHKLIFMMPDFVPAPIGDFVPDEEKDESIFHKVTMTHGIATLSAPRGRAKILTELEEKSMREAFAFVPREHGKTSVPTITGMKAEFTLIDELSSVEEKPVEDKLKPIVDAHFRALERRMAADLVNGFKHGTATVTSNVAEGGLESLKPVTSDDLKRKIAEQIRDLTRWRF